jgi:hypothetical protein
LGLIGVSTLSGAPVNPGVRVYQIRWLTACLEEFCKKTASPRISGSLSRELTKYGRIVSLLRMIEHLLKEYWLI